MNKAELIKAIADDTGASADAVDNVLAALARATSKQLGEGGDVTIPGIAKLTTKTRAARKGRNPATGAEIDIPAKTVVAIKPLKALADHVA